MYLKEANPLFDKLCEDTVAGFEKSFTENVANSLANAINGLIVLERLSKIERGLVHDTAEKLSECINALKAKP